MGRVVVIDGVVFRQVNKCCYVRQRDGIAVKYSEAGFKVSGGRAGENEVAWYDSKAEALAVAAYRAKAMEAVR